MARHIPDASTQPQSDADRTKNGALVGDVYTALIATTPLHHGDPFRYLTALFTNYKAVAAAPTDWLPWNYEDALARLDQRHANAA